MIWEIINPSDSYSIDYPDWEVAAFAGVILGQGQYGLRGIDNDHELPIFLFGGHEEWVKSEFGANSFDEWKTKFLNERKNEVADCLDSVLIGDHSDRASYNKGLELIKDAEARKEWKEHWHDQRRSSMNNIGAYAWELAEWLRNKE